MLRRRINRESPENSLLLLKPTATLAHEGRLRFVHGSPVYKTILRWSDKEAADDSPSFPHVRRITVFPMDRVLFAPFQSQQIVVIDRFSDGTLRDVTRQATYDVSTPSITVRPKGVVPANEISECTVLVRYLDAMTACRLAFMTVTGVLA